MMRMLPCLLGALACAVGTVAAQDALDLDIPNAPVQKWARNGDTLYIAGDFSNVGHHTGALAVANRVTGELVRFPDVVSRQIDAAISDGQGGWYVSGSIESLSASRGAPLAHVRSDGTVRLFPVDLSGGVYDMAVAGDRLFLGGNFTNAGPGRVSYLAALDLDSGELLPWDPMADDVVQDLEVVGDQLYVAGVFANIGGAPRGGLASFRVDPLMLSIWEPQVSGRLSDVSVHGGRVFYIGRGVTVGMDTFDYLAGAVDATSGETIDWRPSDIDFQSVRAVCATDDGVYLGGTFEVIGSSARLGVALFDTTDASLLPFNVRLERDVLEPARVDRIFVSGDDILVEGQFEEANGQPRLGAAVFDRATAGLEPWRVDTPHQDRYAVVADGQNIAVAGRFQGVNTKPRNRIAAIDLVSGEVLPFKVDFGEPTGTPLGVNQLLVSGDRLLVAGSFVSVDGIPVQGLIAVDGTTGELVLDFDPGITADRYQQIIRTPHGLIVRGAIRNEGFVAMVNESTGIPLWITPFSTRPGSTSYVPLTDTVVIVGRNETMDPLTARDGLVEFDARRGALTPFNPDIENVGATVAWNNSLILYGTRSMFVEGVLRRELGAYQRIGDEWVFDPSFELARPSSPGSISTIRVLDDRLLLTGVDINLLDGYVGYRGTLTLPGLEFCTGQLLREPAELVDSLKDRQLFEAYRSIGAVWSLPDEEYLGEHCRIDLDRNCTTDLFDFLAFISLFERRDPVADFDGDGEFTLFDYLAFQSAFADGC